MNTRPRSRAASEGERLAPSLCVEPGCDRPREQGGQRCVLHVARLGPLPQTDERGTRVSAPAAEPLETRAPAPVREVIAETGSGATGQATSRKAWGNQVMLAGAVALVLLAVLRLAWPQSQCSDLELGLFFGGLALLRAGRWVSGGRISGS